MESKCNNFVNPFVHNSIRKCQHACLSEDCTTDLCYSVGGLYMQAVFILYTSGFYITWSLMQVRLASTTNLSPLVNGELRHCHVYFVLHAIANLKGHIPNCVLQVHGKKGLVPASFMEEVALLRPRGRRVSTCVLGDHNSCLLYCVFITYLVHCSLYVSCLTRF